MSPARPRAGLSLSGPVLPDLLAPGLAVVFCGTAAGAVSAQRGAYYAGPGNFFWRVLHEARLTPYRFAPAQFPDLLGLGIGLTDLNKRQFGQDADLDPAHWDVPGLVARLEACRPTRLAFTSKTAASVALGRPTGQLRAGPQNATLAGAEIWVLPSPSGQARRFWDKAPWLALGAAVRGEASLTSRDALQGDAAGG
jgi:TDG/mug DNA glycosylase family protein